MKPVQHVASLSFKELSIEDRDCRFINETGNNNSMFKQYRHLGCMFECRLKLAIINSNCIPWDYPVPGGLNETKFEVCVTKPGPGQGNLTLFNELMESDESMSNCHCQPDCEEIKYEPQVYLK